MPLSYFSDRCAVQPALEKSDLHYMSLFTVTTLWGSKNEASTVIGTRVGCGLNIHNPRMQNAALQAHILQPQETTTAYSWEMAILIRSRLISKIVELNK